MLNKKNYIIPQNIAIKYYFLSENCHNYLYRFFIREQFCKIMALRFLSFMGKLFAGCCPDNDIPTRRIGVNLTDFGRPAGTFGGILDVVFSHR